VQLSFATISDKRKILLKQLKKEAKLVHKESMKVLTEFEKLK
jgi:hypothetical protein